MMYEDAGDTMNILTASTRSWTRLDAADFGEAGR